VKGVNIWCNVGSPREHYSPGFFCFMKVRSIIATRKENPFFHPKAPCLQLLKALSCRNRMNILGFLKYNEASSVHHIAKTLNVSIECVSQHLRILRSAYLVQSEKTGLFVAYSLASPLPKIARLSIEDYLRNYLNTRR
jgi:DNA-binding transcriptional ArsR family regulator